MDLTGTIVEFKKKRHAFKKKPLNVTVNKARIENISNAISAQNNVFDILNESEKLDFLLFMLEKFMVNGQIVPISPVEISQIENN